MTDCSKIFLLPLILNVDKGFCHSLHTSASFCPSVLDSRSFHIIIIVIEFFTSQLWLGNIHLSLDVVINRIRLGGLICSLKSFLQLNMCQELQIFAVVYVYSGAS